MPGRVIGIYTACKGDKPELRDLAEVIAGKGIVGDRYFAGEGTFSEKLAGDRKSEITFIAAEEVDRFNRIQGSDLDYGDLRRNVITIDIDLNALVGKQFSIAGVVFEGIETCEPCTHLAKTVHKAVLPDMMNRAGLRAAVLTSGTLKVGDTVSLDQR
ncbi:MOSC domain-containing protein [Marinimicrobium alkaliphilum]|uniref:MOSC domain-containing protein n=1 Tax=Marinimicrobium alkaliphilum TaxID=2202654 RepID=UPI000DBAA728|nr:MOSC domain-containing protein [Marinimicrobium alkaliphilum]